MSQHSYARLDDAQAHDLDQKFIQTSSAFYKQQLKLKSKKPTTYNKIESLHTDVTQLLAN